jgi:hypothetical protein
VISYLQITRAKKKRAGGLAQVVEHPPSKHQARVLTLVPFKKKKDKMGQDPRKWESCVFLDKEP